ncbi:MAG: hypothetical protein ACI9UA_004142 [Pseudoalteromonas tetraodonis]|jgi:hypothetical protein
MREYKTVAVKTRQGIGGAKGDIDTEKLDRILNEMAKDGWGLSCIEDLEHTSGSKILLCVFERESGS